MASTEVQDLPPHLRDLVEAALAVGRKVAENGLVTAHELSRLGSATREHEIASVAARENELILASESIAVEALRGHGLHTSASLISESLPVLRAAERLAAVPVTRSCVAEIEALRKAVAERRASAVILCVPARERGVDHGDD